MRHLSTKQNWYKLAVQESTNENYQLQIHNEDICLLCQNHPKT